MALKDELMLSKRRQPGCPTWRMQDHRIDTAAGVGP